MRLSSDPVDPGGRESEPNVEGEVGNSPETGSVTGDVAGKYPSISGDTWNNGNTSMVSYD